MDRRRGDGASITRLRRRPEHDEARDCSQEVDRLADECSCSPRDAAVFYRTNAQSCALEEAFMRAGQPYKVIGAPLPYDRREIKDAIATCAPPTTLIDDVNLRRILNVPKRGLGDKAESALAEQMPPCRLLSRCRRRRRSPP